MNPFTQERPSQPPHPCPFCASSEVYATGIGHQVVRCMSCRAEGPAIHAADPAIQARIRCASPAETLPQMLRRFALEAWDQAPRPIPLRGMTTSTCAECGDTVAVEACGCDHRDERDELEAHYLEDRCAACHDPVPECTCDQVISGAMA